MANLITAAEVVALAFGGEQFVRSAVVSEALILSAQSKFVAPVFNALYADMVGGQYDEFVTEYVKPPLALYVKFLLLPSLWAQTGMSGVVHHTSQFADSVDDTALERVLRQTRSNADVLMDRAVWVVEHNIEQFASYDPKQNVRHRISIEGGIVI